MKEVPYRGPTNIRCHPTKFNLPGNLVPGICAPLSYIITGVCQKFKIDICISVSRKARDIDYMKRIRSRYATSLAVKANKLQRHFRPQVNF